MPRRTGVRIVIARGTITVDQARQHLRDLQATGDVDASTAERILAALG